MTRAEPSFTPARSAATALWLAVLASGFQFGCGEDASQRAQETATSDAAVVEVDAGSGPTSGDGGVAEAGVGGSRDGAAGPVGADASVSADASVGADASGDAARDDAGPTTPSTPDAGTVTGDSGPAAGLPPAASTAQDGPFRASEDLRAGPRGKSGLFWPTELGKDGLQHPLFVWGCGGGSTPSSYAELLRRVATHGFVVIAEVSEIGDNGAPLRASIDWLLAENARAGSMLYGKLNAAKIALGGHSIGSVNSFLIADDPRLTTSIHIAGGSLDDVRNPSAPTTGMGGKRLIHPVAYICSMRDSFGNVEKTQKDYDNTKVPAWMTVMTGVEHTGAARSGWAATIAWLRWQLAGEQERRSAFLGAGGEFTQGIYVSRSKNW